MKESVEIRANLISKHNSLNGRNTIHQQLEEQYKIRSQLQEELRDLQYKDLLFVKSRIESQAAKYKDAVQKLQKENQELQMRNNLQKAILVDMWKHPEDIEQQ